MPVVTEIWGMHAGERNDQIWKSILPESYSARITVKVEVF
jgi:hypothetical protein